jgi:hypothetical protein
MKTVPLAAALLLAACAPLPGQDNPPPAPPATTPEACAAAAYRSYVGQPVSALEALQLSQPVRVIGPDDVVTMDFNPRRLNFKHDAAGVIRSVTCG